MRKKIRIHWFDWFLLAAAAVLFAVYFAYPHSDSAKPVCVMAAVSLFLGAKSFVKNWFA